MGERSQALADKFEAAHNDLVSTIESIPDDKWQLTCQNDERPVGVVAHHVGVSYTTTFESVRMAGTGQPVPPMSWEMLNAMNAEHAVENASCTKEDALAVIRKNGSHVRSEMANLDDAMLDRDVHFPLFGPDPVTVERMLDMLVIGHIGMHLPHIKATVA
jgi:hypothetical protein